MVSYRKSREHKAMTSKTKKPAKNSKPTSTKRRPIYILLGAALAIVGVLTLVCCILWFYAERTLPNVMVGNIAAGHKTPAELEPLLAAQQSALTVTFVKDGQATTVAAADLGLAINTPATIQQALQARRGSDLWRNLQIWSAYPVPLVFDNDPGQLKYYVQQHYPEVFKDAEDATLIYNGETNQFDIKPGSLGHGFDLKQFESIIPDLALRPRGITLSLATAPVEPLIQAEGLRETQKTINDRIKLPLRFLHNGQVVHQTSAADIGSWVHFIPDTTRGTASIEFDKAKIEQFITQAVSPKIAAAPLERKVIIDLASGSQTVLQAGRPGQQVTDTARLADAIIDALAINQPLELAVTVSEAPFKTVTLTGSGKWIEVDLSQQTTTLYIGDTPLQTFLISSGTAKTPTQVGTGHIYHKLPVQTMTGTINGEYYYVPNIKWVSYFYGGEAFHGTYWHKNFGHPMSHGCINMRETDAKTLYDFAPIGTKVVVHN